MGRNREFDEEVVLQKAMELFWKQGYEKTSMNDLVEYMGIHRKSIYDTFGDKHTLYLKAIENYRVYTAKRMTAEILRAETKSQAIKNIFHYTIEGMKDKPWGCFFVNAATELGLRDKEVEEKAEEAFVQAEKLFEELIREGQQSGEFSNAFNAASLAKILHSALLGVRVYVRTSADKEELCCVADDFLALIKK